ncbi:diguanylate cyclase domain-containing protein [Litoribrevibacter euphylliae]|uniref:diguanylate cyclase n=1 Tax=Litoribrevibacter euphylliae TaxID=1834034 RepID=A0ABV7HGQ9_9GAMM
MKLKHLLIVVFVILAAIPLFIGLQFLNQYTGEHHRKLFEEHISSLSLVAKQRIVSVVDRIKDNTALISSRTQMRISLAKWNETGAEEHRSKLTKIINDAKFGLSHLKDIQVFNLRGQLVTTTPTHQVIPSLDLAKLNQNNISLEMENDTLVIVNVSPLSLNHEIIGYLKVAFFANVITNLVRDRNGLRQTGEWLIAVRDEVGDALFVVPLKYDHKAAFKRKIDRNRLDIPIIQALLGNEIVMSYAPDYTGTPVLASTRYIKEQDWGIVAKINEEEVNQMVHENAFFIYVAELVIILLSVFVGVVLSVYISSPIERLKKHIDVVAKGSFEHPPFTGGWHEVKELTTHFSYMIQALKDLNENLQTKVDLRTKELVDANKKLEQLIVRDPLTHLYNCRYLQERLIEEIQRAQRYNTPLACILIDIDNFKSINKAWGHEVGDDVLIRLANLLKEAVRETDTLARLAGQRFCIVLSVCSEESARNFLERLRTDISELEFVSANQSFHITCSIGLALMSDTAKDAESMISAAEKALYYAKDAGRNRVVSYSDLSTSSNK